VSLPIKLAAAMAAVVLCWAYSPIGIHIGLQSYSPGHLALLRFLIASAFMAVIALCMGIGLPRLRDVPWLMMLGFFAVVLHHVVLNMGQRWVSPGASSVLAQTAPLFSTLIAALFLKESVSRWRWSWVAVGLAGVLVVIWADKGVGEFRPEGLLLLLAALSWSIYFALQKHYCNRYSPLTIVCYMIWAGTLMLCVYWPGLKEELLNAPARVNGAVLLLGLFPSALAYLLWGYVLSHTQISRSVGVMYLIPPVAMVMAALILGSKVSPGVLLGAAIIVGSVIAMSREGAATGISDTRGRKLDCDAVRSDVIASKPAPTEAAHRP